MDQHFLARVCSLPWKGIGLASIEAKLGDEVRVNHVFIDCETPFVIAASSVQAANREEDFLLVVVNDPSEVKDMMDGPYPPHHRPLVSPLESAFGHDIAAFLSGPKRFRFTRVLAHEGLDGDDMVTPRVQSVAIEGSGVEVTLRADDDAPLSVCVKLSHGGDTPR